MKKLRSFVPLALIAGALYVIGTGTPMADLLATLSNVPAQLGITTRDMIAAGVGGLLVFAIKGQR